jgi:uncharacterized protein YjiS (DUF1127 family)
MIMSILIATSANRASSGRMLAALKLIRTALLWAATGPLRLIRFWRRRRELSALAGMSGYELRDIGLTPFDVANAMESAGPENATDGLARLAQDRRFRRAT